MLSPCRPAAPPACAASYSCRLAPASIAATPKLPRRRSRRRHRQRFRRVPAGAACDSLIISPHHTQPDLQHPRGRLPGHAAGGRGGRAAAALCGAQCVCHRNSPASRLRAAGQVAAAAHLPQRPAAAQELGLAQRQRHQLPVHHAQPGAADGWCLDMRHGSFVRA